ncbi:valine--tRNA ligase-like [Littorina saxatilis]|uniref:Valine--tRNA ligase, mitochondrial n=1 Tax=Littorina saxatilis TaxID=31220 RepID=A0AAN9BZ29_9CAEN
MAASWCFLRLWYRNTGTKLYKSRRRWLASRYPSNFHLVKRSLASSSQCQKDNFQKITYDVKTAKGQKKDTAAPLPQAYSPQYVEAAWYDWWLSQGYFEPRQVERGEKDRFVMLLPPPNVTGTLHLGHALTNSIQDALIRWHRMKGETVLWVPGTDHAGIATQVVVEKTLWGEKRQTRHQLGRHKFEAEVWKWKQEKGNIIENQMKLLGSSFDWSRNFFTLDERPSRAVTEAFVRLHDKGKVYRDQQLVNWSCSLQSSISDIEVDNVEVEGRTKRRVPGYTRSVEFGVLSSFAYPLEDSDEEIVMSTTRLETMLGDTAVAVHPEDDRYAHLVGHRVRHPLCHRFLPIIADTFVDRAFGSGAVKITPGHDPVDREVGRRHSLPALSILDDEGKICGDVPQLFHSLPRFEAREMVRGALTDLGLYRGEVDHAMVLPVCSRSGDVVEARLKEQWFLSCQDMAQRAVEAAQRGELTFSASHHEAVWFEWLTKVRDWCLSRQLWWGHRIPAYRFQTDGGDMWLAARSETEAVSKFQQQHPDLEYLSVAQDEDVLDTWFSSALLPFSVFGWPEDTSGLRQCYPLSLMETGHDILFFWVARMVMLGLELTNTLPFKQVLLHGIVRDVHGRKMSKSLGNVIDPLDVIHGATLEELHSKVDVARLSKEEIKMTRDGQKKDFPNGIPECGTDALRFTLCGYDFKADAVQMDVLHTRTYRLFCNKIWQAFRFTQQHFHGDFTPLDTFTLSGCEGAVDMWILSALSRMVEDCDQAFTSLSLHHATRALHTFWLTHFCDVYLEYCKTVFESESNERQEAVRQMLYLVTDTFLRALSPFMPYLTEELFQRLPAKRVERGESVCIAPYPQPQQFQWQNETVEQEMREVLEIVQHVLSIRHQYSITKPFLPVYIGVESTEHQSTVEKYRSVVCKLCKAVPVHVITDTHSTQSAPTGCASSVVSTTCQLHVQLKGHVDFTRELERLSQRKQKLVEQQQNVASKLSKLMKKGKGHIPAVQKLQAKEESLTAQLKLIAASMEGVSKMRDS